MAKEVMTPEVDNNVTLEELTRENENLKKERAILLNQAQQGAKAAKALEAANNTISAIMNSIEMYKNFLQALSDRGE